MTEITVEQMVDAMEKTFQKHYSDLWHVMLSPAAAKGPYRLERRDKDSTEWSALPTSDNDDNLAFSMATVYTLANHYPTLDFRLLAKEGKVLLTTDTAMDNAEGYSVVER